MRVLATFFMVVVSAQAAAAKHIVFKKVEPLPDADLLAGLSCIYPNKTIQVHCNISSCTIRLK